MLVTPEFAGTTEPGLNFIDDQQNAVLIGAGAQASKKFGICWDITTFTQYRLHEKCCSFLRRAYRREQMVQFAQSEVGGCGSVPAIMRLVVKGVRERGYVNPSHEGRN